MYSDHYGVLSAPENAEQFTNAMEAICRGAGAEVFVAVKLKGLTPREVAQTAHNGGPRLESFLSPLTLSRLVAALHDAPVPAIRIGREPGCYAFDAPGICHGVAALARHQRVASLLVFARSEPAVVESEVMPLMAAVSLAAQFTLAGYVAEHESRSPLRDRELECLTYYLAGYGTKKTAQALGISARTVEGHLDRARVRCGVGTTMAVAMKAMSEGWIKPEDVRRLEAAAAEG